MFDSAVHVQESFGITGSQSIPCVLIVDDDISVRESLELLLEAAGWEVVTFASAADFLAHPKMSVPTCLLLDVALPDANGLALQARLATDYPTTPIVVISGNADIPMAVRAMRGGAMEVLTKPLAPEALLAAVGNALDASRGELHREARNATIRESHASLTRRESEVMSLVVAGRLNKQVGGELGISEITVKAHRGNLMRKMRARSLPDLVRMAAQLGFAS